MTMRENHQKNQSTVEVTSGGELGGSDGDSKAEDSSKAGPEN
jgi:hypothetical protein